MKYSSIRSFFLVFICALGMGIVSCKKGGNPENPVSGEQTPVSRPVGETIGAAINKSIGAAGGQLATADGSLTVIVPAGALSETVNFQLQPVKGTCDAGLGNGFRLTPHGKQFSKPVTVRFSYARYMDSIPSEDALSLAWQDEKGIWQMVQPFVVDKVNKTVSVSTKHFSDWILVTWLKIKPASAVLGTGESINLQVMNYHPFADDMLAPLNAADESTLPLGEGKPVSAVLVKKWILTSPGKLQANGSAATYTAPGTVNGQVEATAIAEIASDAHQLLLLAHITVLGEGLAFRINGGDWQVLEGSAMLIGTSSASINGLGDGVALTLICPAGAGSFGWRSGSQNPASLAHSDQEAGYQHSSYYYDASNAFKDSDGAVVIDKWGNKGDWVIGRFNCAPAGRFSADSKQIGTAAIDGYFRVKRVI
jgi:hypothetical protein